MKYNSLAHKQGILGCFILYSLAIQRSLVENYDLHKAMIKILAVFMWSKEIDQESLILQLEGGTVFCSFLNFQINVHDFSSHNIKVQVLLCTGN